MGVLLLGLSLGRGGYRAVLQAAAHVVTHVVPEVVAEVIAQVIPEVVAVIDGVLEPPRPLQVERLIPSVIQDGQRCWVAKDGLSTEAGRAGPPPTPATDWLEGGLREGLAKLGSAMLHY